MLTDMLMISLTVSAAVLVLCAAAPLTDRRYRVAWRYYVFVFLAVRLLIPLRAELPAAPVQLPRPVDSPVVFFEPPTPSEPASAESAPQVNTKFVSRGDIVSIVWLCGTAAVLVWHFTKYFLFLYAMKKNRKPLLRSGRVEIFTSSKLETPLLIGYFRPRIYLPEGVYDENEQEQVIAHELVHYRRGDLWVKLLFLLAISAHWFNPVIHYMVRRAVRDMEFSCDDAAVRGKDTDYKKSYSGTILKTIKTKDVTK